MTSISARSCRTVCVTASLLSFCAACTGAHKGADDAGPSSTDADTDSDADADTESESDTGEPIPGECPTSLVPPCSDGVSQLPRIFAAEDLGEGYVLVDATPRLVLAERDAGGSNEVTAFATLSHYFNIWDPPSWWEGTPWTDTIDVGAAHAVGAVDVPHDVMDSDVMSAILVCRADASCDVHLLREVSNDLPDPDEVALDTAPTWTLDAQLAARAIVPAEDGIAYVVGNGAVQLLPGGEVYGLVAPDTGGTLNDGACDGVFVGQLGRIAANAGSEWASIDEESGTDAGLRAVDEIIAADDGTVGTGDMGAWQWIAVADEPIVEAASRWGWEAQAVALTESGCVIRDGMSGDDFGFCLEGTLPEPGVRILFWTCDYADNTTFLTPHGMYGVWDCYTFD